MPHALPRLREVAARVAGKARLTLDPSERHGFEYQSWLGFTLYADGLRGALGRGGAYRILGAGGSAGEAAFGFSLYPDELIDTLGRNEAARDTLFLPLGHDAEAAARLRAIGWRTVAALCRSRRCPRRWAAPTGWMAARRSPAPDRWHHLGHLKGAASTQLEQVSLTCKS